MTDSRSWKVNMWDLIKLTGIKDKESFKSWIRQNHPDKGGDCDAVALVQTFYNRFKTPEGVLAHPKNYVSSFAGGGVKPDSNTNPTATAAPPPQRATAAQPTTANATDGQYANMFSGNSWFGSNGAKRSAERAEMQKRARGHPYAGYCQKKVKYAGGSRGDFTFDNTGLQLKEMVNCQNKSRPGSRYCASHKKFDTPEEIRQVAQKRAAIDAERAKTKKVQEDVKRAAQQEYDAAYISEMGKQ
jgi:hypothetical protein